MKCDNCESETECVHVGYGVCLCNECCGISKSLEDSYKRSLKTSEKIERMVHAFSDKERKDAVRNSALEVKMLEDQNGKLLGLLRSAREIIWNHHAEGLMVPDTCPWCTNDKEVKWVLDQIDAALK